MKIYIAGSKQFYDKVSEIKSKLEMAGHSVTPPNGFDVPEAEIQMKEMSDEDHQKWKAEMIREDGRVVAGVDAVLVLNFEKRGQPNYVGGATFLEMFKAFELGKKLFLYNPIPDNMLADEIAGFGPTVIHGNLDLIV